MQQSLAQIEDTKTDFFEVFMFCAFYVAFIHKKVKVSTNKSFALILKTKESKNSQFIINCYSNYMN